MEACDEDDWNESGEKSRAIEGYPRNRPWRPIGLGDVKDPALSDDGKDVNPTHQSRSINQKY
jgi:hypothetical protein